MERPASHTPPDGKHRRSPTTRLTATAPGAIAPPDTPSPDISALTPPLSLPGSLAGSLAGSQGATPPRGSALALTPQAGAPIRQVLALGAGRERAVTIHRLSGSGIGIPAHAPAIRDLAPPVDPGVLARMHRLNPPSPLNYRQRHPVLTISASAAMRDFLGQTVGRVFYLLSFSLMASAMFHTDAATEWRRRLVLLVLGSLFALVMGAIAGRRTAAKVSALAYPQSSHAYRRSRLHALAIVPPLASGLGIGLSSLFFGIRGAALSSANSVARIFQFYGRDAAGQTWVSRTQYDPQGRFPGFSLVAMTNGQPLAEADPAAARSFQFQRVWAATVLYCGLCIGTYALVPRLQSELFNRDSQDMSLEAFFGANLGPALASIGLEIADAITGVLAFPITAWIHGYQLVLGTQTAPFDVPRAILHNGHARLTFNALHEVFSPFIERYPNPVMAVVLRTLAQTLTEPRGFVDAQGRAILDRWDREACEDDEARAQDDSELSP